MKILETKLTPNQFHHEVYDLTVVVDELPIVEKSAIHTKGDTTYWYGENSDGFVEFGISHDRRVFNHEPNYMWSSRASVFNGLFPNCHCKEITVVHNGYRYGYLAMTVPAITKLLSSEYELYAFVDGNGEYFIKIGEAFQLFTDDQLWGHGELVESFRCEKEVN